MDEALYSIFIFLGVCLLFVVIAFFINRKRLIKKYDLDNGLIEQPEIEIAKKPIDTTKIILASSLVVILLIWGYSIYSEKRKVYTITFTPKETVDIAKMNQAALAKMCVLNGFTEIYTDDKSFKLYEKLCWHKTKNTAIYERIKYAPDSIGKIQYLFTDVKLYKLFKDSLKKIKSEFISRDLSHIYKSDFPQTYTSQCFIRECGFVSKYDAYTVEIIAVKKYQESINQLNNKYLKEKTKKEQEKQEKERQFGYVKYDETYLYETPSYEYKRQWYLKKGTKVKCLDTSGSYVFVMYDSRKGNQLAGWIYKTNLSKRIAK